MDTFSKESGSGAIMVIIIVLVAIGGLVVGYFLGLQQGERNAQKATPMPNIIIKQKAQEELAATPDVNPLGEVKNPLDEVIINPFQ